MSSLQNNDSKIENIQNKEERIQNYQNAGVVLDAVNSLEKATQELLVVSKTNSNYSQMPDLNKISEEDINTYKTQLEKSIPYELKQSEIKKTDNGNEYIHIATTVQDEENSMDMSIYYTIMNGRLLTISFRYYNQNDQVGNEQEQQIIQGVQFYEVERPTYLEINEATNLAMGISFILLIIITIIVLIIRRKDKKLFNNNIKDIKLKQYSRFGGLILFFWSLCFYQILLCVIDLDTASKLENMQFYSTAVSIQSTILALISMYQIYITVRRKETTPRKVIRSNIIAIVVGIVINVARIIYALIVPLEIYTKEYFEQEISTLIFGIVYPLIWILYFTFSKRVQYYYYLHRKE